MVDRACATCILHNVFIYEDSLLNRFPSIHGGVVAASGLANAASPGELLDEFSTEQQQAVLRFSGSLSDVESIAAWRRAFREFGVKPTKYRNAAESLLRRLTKQGELPTINLLVDIGNLVSIRYALPVAVMSQTSVAGLTTVRFANGDESFDDLGSSDAVNPEPGEVIFVDNNGSVSARRWCWRQSAHSAANIETTDALFVVEAQHESGLGAVEAATNDLCDLLGRYQPQAVTRHGFVSVDNPHFV